jgi:glucan biosynthesis protein C
MPQRRHEIDALRVLATLLLIVFHTGMVFSAFDTFHIQNLQRSEIIGRVDWAIHGFHMPLFFFLSGMATWYALGSRSPRQYAGERFRRLFIPLVVGILFIIPPQVYVERIATWIPTRTSPINFSGSFFSWYPHTFECCYSTGNLSWHHLWFLAYLFTYSLALLPLLRRLRNGTGSERLMRVTGFLSRGWNILLPAIWLVATEIALRSTFPNWQDLVSDWANHANYPFVFLMGFVIVSDERLDAAVRRVWPAALVTAVTAAIIAQTGVPYAADRALAGVGEWTALVGLLGLGRAVLSRPVRWIRRFSQVSLPFYIWHQTVIVVFAYFVVQWETSVTVKYWTVTLVALAITWTLSELVRLTPVTRFAFGLPTRRQAPVSLTASRSDRNSP